MFSNLFWQLAAVSGGSMAIIGAIVLIVKVVRKLNRVADDILGEPPRATGEAKPGWGQRLLGIETSQAELKASQQRFDEGQIHVIRRISELDSKLAQVNHRVEGVERQFEPDHGYSIRDRIDRIEEIIQRKDQP